MNQTSPLLLGLFSLSLVGCGAIALPELKLPAAASARSAVTAAVSDQLPAPQTVQACIATAEQLAEQEHWREAMLLYQKARGLSPSQINYAARLAPLYDLLDDAASARQAFDEAVQASPRDANLLNDHGCFLDRIGELAAAEQQLLRALEIDPRHARGRNNLGRNLAHQGRYDDSWREFSAVVGPAVAHYNVGVILARQKQTEPARRAFQDALRLQPNLPQAEQFLAQL